MWWLSVANAGSFAPTQATQIAMEWDGLYKFLLISSLVACVLLIGGMIYFVTKYRRKTNRRRVLRQNGINHASNAKTIKAPPSFIILEIMSEYLL